MRVLPRFDGPGNRLRGDRSAGTTRSRHFPDDRRVQADWASSLSPETQFEQAGTSRSRLHGCRDRPCSVLPRGQALHGFAGPGLTVRTEQLLNEEQGQTPCADARQARGRTDRAIHVLEQGCHLPSVRASGAVSLEHHSFRPARVGRQRANWRERENWSYPPTAHRGRWQLQRLSLLDEGRTDLTIGEIAELQHSKVGHLLRLVKVQQRLDRLNRFLACF
jgi:hypothetical protein